MYGGSFRKSFTSEREDRASVTNLTGDNMNLTTQVIEYANHLANKDTAMEPTQKTISQLQGENKTLKRKLSDHTIKKTDTIQHQYKKKDVNWWSGP